MTDLHSVLAAHVENGSVPGAVGLVARGGQVEVAAVGSASPGGVPMARDSIFRVASITKPITAAAVMILLEDGRIALADPAGEWLPELAKPVVVRTPASAVGDVVPAARPITVFDLLSAQAGYGDHTTAAQREIGALFLEGQGWGFGGSVDIAAIDPWNVPGRYGWVGGTGTSAHIVPSAGTVAILLAQVAADSPVPPAWMRDFWRYAASAA